MEDYNDSHERVDSGLSERDMEGTEGLPSTVD
jgi:hypothetical protein